MPIRHLYVNWHKLARDNLVSREKTLVHGDFFMEIY